MRDVAASLLERAAHDLALQPAHGDLHVLLEPTLCREGDASLDGDHFTVNGTQLSNSENPVNNFFNSSRTTLGQPVSGAADVPALSGGPDAMGGYDLDVVDVTASVAAGDTSAIVGADSTFDIFFLGGFVTSITNKSPDFGAMTKTAVDLNGGALLPGDIVEYTIAARNGGNDDAIGAVITDAIDLGLDQRTEA